MSLNDTAFHFACMNGFSKIAELLMEKSEELDIELNEQNGVGYSAFHLACLMREEWLK